MPAQAEHMSVDYGVYLHGDLRIERKYLIRERLVELAGLSGPSDILDVGCGMGLVAIAFALSSSQHRVQAIDVWNQDEIADSGPEWVLRNAALEGVSNVAVRSGDARRIPFTDNTFDLVVSNLVVHNIPRSDQPAVFSEMKRTLRPGGLLLYSDIDADLQFERAQEYVLGLKFTNVSIRPILTLRDQPSVGVQALLATKLE
jgi:ubiquinone/menaquinone biosynthesis C-methylase UbiE